MKIDKIAESALIDSLTEMRSNLIQNHKDISENQKQEIIQTWWKREGKTFYDAAIEPCETNEAAIVLSLRMDNILPGIDSIIEEL